MRPALLFLVLATPMAAAADVVHLSNGQVVTGVVRSCQGGDIVIEPPGSALGLFVSQVVATTIDVASFAYEEPPSRFAVGALLAPAGRDPRTVRKQVSGLQLSLRF